MWHIYMKFVYGISKNYNNIITISFYGNNIIIIKIEFEYNQI
jgi:hypothetical protein